MKTDVWASLWGFPTTRGKIHKKVFNDLLWRMSTKWTFHDIYHEVTMIDPNMDDDDILATTRALVAERDKMRHDTT